MEGLHECQQRVEPLATLGQAGCVEWSSRAGPPLTRCRRETADVIRLVSDLLWRLSTLRSRRYGPHPRRATIELEAPATGGFGFTMLSPHGRTLLRSRPFRSRREAIEALNEFREFATDRSRYERREKAATDTWFVFRSAAGNPIAETAGSGLPGVMEHTLSVVIQQAPHAAVHGFSTAQRADLAAKQD